MAFNFQNPYQNPYQSYYQQPPQMQAPTPQQNNNSIVWVQGEAGAKSYLVGAGNSVLLMDSENPVFYIKSMDLSGMPLPLRVFSYEEKTTNNTNNQHITNNDQYVTHDELEKRLQEIIPKSNTAKLLKEDKADG